jgi:hypothetical protein
MTSRQPLTIAMIEDNLQAGDQKQVGVRIDPVHDFA